MLEGLFRDRDEASHVLGRGLYTTARRLLKLEAHHRGHKYEEELRDAARELARAKLARTAVRLSGRVGIQEREPQARLYVEVAPESKYQFAALTAPLGSIGDYGESMQGGDCLYLDVVAASLVQEEERRTAQQYAVMRAQRLPYPAVTDPVIVERDIYGYKLKWPLPDRRDIHEKMA